MNKKGYYILFLLCFMLLPHLHGQRNSYQLFENIGLGPEASVTNCFLQDRQGIIWIGSNKGLFSYDGYSVQAHLGAGKANNAWIYCGVIIDQTYLYLGTDNGMLIYNYKTDQYETPAISFPKDFRSMALQGDHLWIGTLNGLFVYHIRNHTLKQFDTKRYKGLTHSAVYSIIHTTDNHIYVGTYNGLSRYIVAEDRFEPVNLPAAPGKKNLFINSLLEDVSRQCIWIGTEGSLFKYSPSNGQAEQIESVHANSIKSLALDAKKDLLIGTDNGLYVYHEKKAVLHALHDSRNRQSLADNIVWNIFADREHNIWLGTNYGISLSRNNSAFQYIPIAQITGTGEGNQFFSLYKDVQGWYWLGGSNGIIRTKSPADNLPDAIWYNMGDALYHLPHNRIRHIYQDSSNDLWIATDGSINRYDYRQKRFIHYNITDKTGKYNANWAYHLMEDGQGNLWVATCLGGIFIVNKEKLMKSQSETYVAEYNFTTKDGLSGMFINQLLPDKEGNVWALLYNNGIDKINIRTRQITHVKTDLPTRNNKPNYLLADKEGHIWAGFRGGVLRMNPRSNEIQPVYLGSFSNNEILSMLEVENNIWISASNGFWVVNKKTLAPRRLDFTSRRFTSMFYDRELRQIYLGDVDGIAITSPDVLNMHPTTRSIVATALYINGLLSEQTGEGSIRYARNISLNHQQNNLAIEFSDLPFSLEEKNKFVYQLKGVDAGWHLLDPNSNRITYNNLNPGSYVLHISKIDANGNPAEQAYTLNVHVSPPWYYTTWAKLFYFLLGVGLILWAVNFFRMKNRLRMERMEKAKIMEQSRQKIDFFTNLSHDFKTPLSLIIAPVSRLLPEISNPQEKKVLEGIQRNAMKINSLVHQVLDFSRIDGNANTFLILSHTEMVSFTRNQFQSYEELAKEKNITLRYETNREELFVNIDIIKWESILHNLLSNALKYTPAGGSISLSLNYKETEPELAISVSDTGIGISQQDVPYIFQRFFQSSRTKGKKEGTGIGLYLVKRYAELHGVNITVASEEDKGTTVTLTMPITADTETSGAVAAPSGLPDATGGPATDEGALQPLILIVEDEPEICRMIKEVLGNRYRYSEASNGKEGLKHCIEEVPDLVITDFMMPLMNGMEMCNHIKKYLPTSAIPIIMLTGVSNKETELESIRHHIDSFITKPFEASMLLSRVEQLLSKKQILEAQTRIETLSVPQKSDAVSFDEKFLADVTRMIEDHMDDAGLNVNMLCQLSDISNKQMYRKIKQLTGLSPVEYIKNIRMKKAAMLLEQQKFSIAEVMYMVGFSSSSYFSKCFQSEFGVTPKQYMEKS